MIKLGTRLVRETTAHYEYTDGDELKTEQIRVRYYSFTIAEQREMFTKIRAIAEKKKSKPVAEREPIWLSDEMPFRIESLPDIAGLNGKPIKPEFDKNGLPTDATTKNFEAISARNLELIQKAINEDQRPKEQPVKSPNG